MGSPFCKQMSHIANDQSKHFEFFENKQSGFGFKPIIPNTNWLQVILGSDAIVTHSFPFGNHSFVKKNILKQYSEQ